MNESTSPARIESNRRNALSSTGPKSIQGKNTSRMNAFKHGIRSFEVVVRGRCLKEDHAEFADLHDRLWDTLNPVGALEEMLADQIVTTHWRLRRALKAESAEISLSVDNGQSARSDRKSLMLSWFMPDLSTGAAPDPVKKMRESALGNSYLENTLRLVRDEVEQAGELNEPALEILRKLSQGKPNHLLGHFERVHANMQQEKARLDPSALKEWALSFVDSKLKPVLKDKAACEKKEKQHETALQAAAALPAPEVLEKITRYTKPLERQLFQAMNQLERLQQQRQGKNAPASIAVEISSCSLETNKTNAINPGTPLIQAANTLSPGGREA
jgi:hypothetical protein